MRYTDPKWDHGGRGNQLKLSTAWAELTWDGNKLHSFKLNKNWKGKNCEGISIGDSEQKVEAAYHGFAMRDKAGDINARLDPTSGKLVPPDLQVHYKAPDRLAAVTGKPGMDAITHIFQFDMSNRLERIIVVASLNGEPNPRIRAVFSIACQE